MTETTYRVVQWATGNIGTRSLRAVIEHPHMTLAGVWVHSEAKVGRDAGSLCGLENVGVIATNKLDDVLALGADCVLYMPQYCDFEEICALLESGANVVTTRGEFHHPASIDAAVRARIEQACMIGRTSIHSTGSSPGFITEAVPIVLTSIQRRLDHLMIDEYANLSKRNSPTLLFELMGFGAAPEDFDRRRWSHGAVAFGPTLRALAEAIGLPLDSVASTGEIAVARETTHIAAGEIKAGTVAGQRMIVTGIRNGESLLTFRANWFCTEDLVPMWDLRATGWRLTVAGDAPLDVEIRLDVPLEHMGELSPGYTAHRAVNAVPAVCVAEPGIRTTADLPQVVANFSR